MDGLACCPPRSIHVVARLDIPGIVTPGADLDNEDVIIDHLGAVVDIINTRVAGTDGQCLFTGLLLAGFAKHFRPAVVNELARLIGDMGLDLWLELSHPEYLTEGEACSIDMGLIQGLVYRNGMIGPDGGWQSFFQMTAMRTVMRAVAAQRVAHSIPLVMWETVGDTVELEYATLARAHRLYAFYNALSWIGHEDALTNAEAAKTRTFHAKPLGALMWLKNEGNMAAHAMWRANNDVCSTAVGHAQELYESLECLVPGLSSRLRLLPPPAAAGRPVSESDTAVPSRSPSVARGYTTPDPLSTSSRGEDFTGLGCFQLGHEPTFAEFDDLRRSQRRLRDLNLLARVEGDRLAEARARIGVLLDASHGLGSSVSQAVGDLLNGLGSTAEDGGCGGGEQAPPPRISIFSGLHSAFQTTTGAQYWGLYDWEPEADHLVLYLSNKAEDTAGTTLHTFLSARNCTRQDCFLAEHAMGANNGGGESNSGPDKTWKLPPRLLRDIEQLSPAEALLLLERVQSAGPDFCPGLLGTRIRDCLEYQLIELPTLAQQRAMGSTAFLGGEISAEALVASRLEWLASKGCSVPDQSEAIALFNTVQARLCTVLTRCEDDVYAQLSAAMQALLRKGHVDAGVDMLALSVFSAFRRLALDEVYLEVLDRNVYPNLSYDQPGCFAEHFALGSRCDSFFDTNARNVGRILAARYRAYYMEHQPPLREEGFKQLPTTYAAMQVDFGPDDDGKEALPFYYHITFFGIFALPALFDVMLLTTIGRGLFLTTFMASVEKTMATTALMLALVVSGAFGAWICSGGSYYFFASAFPVMNLFVVTRFVAGVAFTVLMAIIGFAMLLPANGVMGALVFAFYFVMLTTYMMVLSALSIYQSPGSSFLSGRTAILCCIPILFISPVLSMFTGNDMLVYVPVLSAFLVTILLAARNTIGRWSSWHLGIPVVADAEVVQWYRGVTTLGESELARTTDQQLMHLARTALHAAVLRERRRRWWWYYSSASAAADPLVARLAKGYESTMFLMRWYTNRTRSRMPLQYGTTWNLMLNTARESMIKMQKGLKLHSAFLHWRTTGLDIWSGLLYFLVALADKWVALFTGASLVGLSAASSETFRLGVGWGLCYYLVGALMLDIVSQPLWSLANEKSKERIASLEGLGTVTAQDAAARRRLYSTNLARFFFLHLWAVAVFAALMWVFQDSRDNTVMFLSYIGAYSGLLFYQYNKIFLGFEGEKPLVVAVVVGFPAGFALHSRLPEFPYSGVISLSAATWTAGVVSLFMAKLGWPGWPGWIGAGWRPGVVTRSDDGGVPPTPPTCSYSVSTLEPHPELSEATVSKMFEAARRLGPGKRCLIDPDQHLGLAIARILSEAGSPGSLGMLRDAFPSAEQLAWLASESWQRRKTTVELVSANDFPPSEPRIRAVARKSGGALHIFVILAAADRVSEQGVLHDHLQPRAIAEAIVQATAEHWLGLSHDVAMLSELLVAHQAGDYFISVPEGVKRQLETYEAERTRVIEAHNKTLLRHLLLGVDSDREWEQLPQTVRSFLLRRLCGSTASPSPRDEAWLCEKLGVRGPFDAWMAQCRLGAALTRAVLAYARHLELDAEFEPPAAAFPLGPQRDEHPLLTEWVADDAQGSKPGVFSSMVHKAKMGVKFLIISLTADPEYQRELDLVLGDAPSVWRWPVVFFLNGIWVYSKFLQGFLVPIILFHGRENASEIRRLIRGATTVLERSRVTTESFGGPSTLFWAAQEDGSLRVSQYAGRHDREPQDRKTLKAVNTYDRRLLLRQRDVYAKESITNSFRYEYQDETSRLPMQRECVAGALQGEMVKYDTRGYQRSGSAMQGVNRVDWKLWYRKSPKHEDELLWGEYAFPHVTIKVLWSMPPRNPQARLEEWIPFSAVTEATFIQGDDTYHASWDYDHKFHPTVAVTRNGEPVATPAMISEDWFHVLKKPENCSFLGENPLLPFCSINTNAVSRFLGLNAKRYPIPTSVARTQVWKAWRSSPDVDAVSARWLDEKLVRSDAAVRPYWRLRNMGRLAAAKAYLDAQADTIMARVDVDPQTSSWVHLAFKISDLYSFGEGGDARINTRKLESQLADSDRELHVLAMDTSTWPNDPGGVSNCRRDMVNNLESIRWHVVAETANDYSVPRYQIERNVQSLTVLPLWGLDFLNPAHGVLETTLDSAVVQRSVDTTTADIVRDFLPILTSLVRCAQAIQITPRHVEEATRALVDLNTYFDKSRNWTDVWKHPAVLRRWCELWLSEDMRDEAVTISQWWDFERPTLGNLENALDLWCRYLFIFALPVPGQIPDVFQASHHFCGAMYGIVCKVKRGCSLHVWDHCISFREFTTFMSSAVSFDAPFVNSTLISLTHLSCVLLEHHADVVLPCCDYFNPGWEVELGTAGGALEHRRTFERKIDPVVNGISNMESFEPIQTIRTDRPTVVMLSHVQYPKDLKNAILAADIIVNKWRFRDYRLHIYGDRERHPTLATELIELISSKNLQDHCLLLGLANPAVVLQDAWLFLNSSISEGLPLAMGEAALTGVAVVCTDVGASYCVVTDRATGLRFSEVVPPNDSESLARAQISVMGLLGPWSAYADDPPGTDVPELAYPMPSPEQVRRVEARIYEKTEQRRALGLRGRQNVLKNFSADRYLREHEQMLWIGKDRSAANRARLAAAAAARGDGDADTPASARASKRPRGSRLTPQSWISLSTEKEEARMQWW